MELVNLGVSGDAIAVSSERDDLLVVEDVSEVRLGAVEGHSLQSDGSLVSDLEVSSQAGATSLAACGVVHTHEHTHTKKKRKARVITTISNAQSYKAHQENPRILPMKASTTNSCSIHLSGCSGVLEYLWTIVNYRFLVLLGMSETLSFMSSDVIFTSSFSNRLSSLFFLK